MEIEQTTTDNLFYHNQTNKNDPVPRYTGPNQKLVAIFAQLSEIHAKQAMMLQNVDLSAIYLPKHKSIIVTTPNSINSEAVRIQRLLRIQAEITSAAVTIQSAIRSFHVRGAASTRVDAATKIQANLRRYWQTNLSELRGILSMVDEWETWMGIKAFWTKNNTRQTALFIHQLSMTCYPEFHHSAKRLQKIADARLAAVTIQHFFSILHFTPT